MCAVQLAAIFYAFQHRMTGWEPLWVLGFECVLYATNTFVPDIGTPTPHTHQPTTSVTPFHTRPPPSPHPHHPPPPAGDLVLSDGKRIAWLRYCGWLMTCPVLLMFLVSMTTFGGRRAPVRLVPLLIANQGMVLTGVTACAYDAPNKWGVYMVSVSAGGMVLTLSTICLAALYSLASDRLDPHDRKSEGWRWPKLRSSLGTLGATAETAFARGAAAAHSLPARKEAARKLASNHTVVLRDLTRADGPPATQPALKRLAGHERDVDGFLYEVACRLVGRRSIAPTSERQAATWAAAATYLAARLQTSAAEMRKTPGHEGRKPDMSPDAGAAFSAVLAEVAAEPVVTGMAAWLQPTELRNAKLLSGAMVLSFVAGWALFPISWTLGHNGMGKVGAQTEQAMYMVGDLLAKNAFVFLAVVVKHCYLRHLEPPHLPPAKDDSFTNGSASSSSQPSQGSFAKRGGSEAAGRLSEPPAENFRRRRPSTILIQETLRSVSPTANRPGMQPSPMSPMIDPLSPPPYTVGETPSAADIGLSTDGDDGDDARPHHMTAGAGRPTTAVETLQHARVALESVAGLLCASGASGSDAASELASVRTLCAAVLKLSQSATPNGTPQAGTPQAATPEGSARLGATPTAEYVVRGREAAAALPKGKAPPRPGRAAVRSAPALLIAAPKSRGDSQQQRRRRLALEQEEQEEQEGDEEDDEQLSDGVDDYDDYDDGDGRYASPLFTRVPGALLQAQPRSEPAPAPPPASVRMGPSFHQALDKFQRDSERDDATSMASSSDGAAPALASSVASPYDAANAELLKAAAHLLKEAGMDDAADEATRVAEATAAVASPATVAAPAPPPPSSNVGTLERAANAAWNSARDVLGLTDSSNGAASGAASGGGGGGGGESKANRAQRPTSPLRSALGLDGGEKPAAAPKSARPASGRVELRAASPQVRGADARRDREASRSTSRAAPSQPRPSTPGTPASVTSSTSSASTIQGSSNALIRARQARQRTSGTERVALQRSHSAEAIKHVAKMEAAMADADSYGEAYAQVDSAQRADNADAARWRAMGYAPQ